MSEIFQSSQLILGTYDLLTMDRIDTYLKDSVQTLIIDDAHSMFELETLLSLNLSP